ncbi:SCAN box domain-containing protein [Nephila pilipes]|uniref:SCAN box domain-containing protein n=1 Tax=Nephila pilipes TaxID=299642 RepID=A0A8X6NVN6_NEPPI|nr:SCAN box domain-containing protein [Nephila pilipes]
MAQVPKKDCVAYLSAVLPPELSNMPAREVPDNASNYDFVKSLILKRYNYFSEWISKLKSDTFQQLKDLMVTEQLKFRVPLDVREHYLEDWLKFTTPFELAEKVDDYGNIRESFKKKDQPKRNFANFRGENGITMT